MYGWGTVSEVGKVVANFGKKCLLVTYSESNLRTLREKIIELCQREGVDVICYNEQIF